MEKFNLRPETKLLFQNIQKAAWGPGFENSPNAREPDGEFEGHICWAIEQNYIDGNQMYLDAMAGSASECPLCSTTHMICPKIMQARRVFRKQLNGIKSLSKTKIARERVIGRYNRKVLRTSGVRNSMENKVRNAIRQRGIKK